MSEGLETYVARILGRRHFTCEVLRVSLGVMVPAGVRGSGIKLLLPVRALVIHRVLQTVPVFVMGGPIARARVPRAPVLVQVLESGQVSVSGRARARVCTPISMVVLSRPLQQTYTPPASSVVAYALWIRT